MQGAGQYVPGLGFKIYPSQLATMAGIPVVGNVWYVDGVNGSDTANAGNSFTNAFATLYKAHSVAADNNYDLILVASTGVGSGSGTNESSQGPWTFSKNLVTVLGASAPSEISPRERILWDTSGQSTSTALFTVSGSGNRFINVMLGTFVDNNILINVTGSRNVFSAVHFAGIGDATAGDDTAARSLIITGGQENLFENCIIGVDTVARSTTNAEIELLSQATRNVFRGCKILAYADNAGHFFVKANASSSAIDRWVIFEDCMFINPTQSAATTMTDAMAVDASLSGSIIVKGQSYKQGTTGWGDNVTNILLLGPTPNNGAFVPTAAAA